MMCDDMVCLGPSIVVADVSLVRVMMIDPTRQQADYNVIYTLRESGIYTLQVHTLSRR
jgi:hypothetical protein